MPLLSFQWLPDQVAPLSSPLSARLHSLATNSYSLPFCTAKHCTAVYGTELFVIQQNGLKVGQKVPHKWIKKGRSSTVPGTIVVYQQSCDLGIKIGQQQPVDWRWQVGVQAPLHPRQA